MTLSVYLMLILPVFRFITRELEFEGARRKLRLALFLRNIVGMHIDLGLIVVQGADL